MFQKILIANRGEIAVRVIRTCQAMGVRTAAIYSDADADALHVRLADEAYRVGEAPSAASYLQQETIIEVAQRCGAAAIHPGYGFLSENAEFAARVRNAGLIFIGPSANAIEQMGSKTAARELMQAAGVPVVPGYQGSIENFAPEAESMGYPVLIKAAAGGGGKGMRVVEHPRALQDSIASAQREARNAFGDDQVFLEKYLPIAHHIEFQVLADSQGNTVHLFERECSIQRRHQKIIEESPSPLLDSTLREEMGAAAVAAAQAVRYENAGTIEFIVDNDGNFYFLEMNTRLQVEHPVTEFVTGLDLVRLQLKVAAGEALPFSQDDLAQRGHAIECRIYAEDPANEFLPSIGDILHAQAPLMPNVRVDAGVSTGDAVTTYYDPMIAKVITYGANRDAAIQQMQNALQQYIILGVTTNRAFLQAVLEHPVFQAGETTTDFIPRQMADWLPQTDAIPDAALIGAGLLEILATGGTSSTGGSAPSTEGDPYSPWGRSDHFRMGASNS